MIGVRILTQILTFPMLHLLTLHPQVKEMPLFVGELLDD